MKPTAKTLRLVCFGVLLGLVLAATTPLGEGARALFFGVINHFAEPAEPVELARAAYGEARFMGVLENRSLREVSGLSASRRSPDLFWALNDGGDEPRLYALGADGRDRGSLLIEGAENRDWEALAAFEIGAIPYLLIGDIGDNNAREDAIHFYAVKEPPVPGERIEAGSTVTPAFHLVVRYPEGARDAEALAVDPVSGDALILTKGDDPPELHAFPLVPSIDPAATPLELTTRKVGVVATLPKPTQHDLENGGLIGLMRSMPTALRIAPDGRTAIVLTYRDAYEFVRAPFEDWARAFARAPKRIPLPLMEQAEAAALDPSDGSLWVTSEGRPAPLYRVPRLETPGAD